MLAWSMPAVAQMGPAKWGNPNQSWGTRRPVTDKDRALVANYRSGHKQPVIETNFTSPDELHSQWDLQTDDKSDLKSCRLPENIVTTNTGLQLQTLAATKCHAKWSTGSMISKAKQQFFPGISWLWRFVDTNRHYIRGRWPTGGRHHNEWGYHQTCRHPFFNSGDGICGEDPR